MKNRLTCSTCAYFSFGAVQFGLDEREHLRVDGQRGGGGVLDALGLRPRHHLLLVERESASPGTGGDRRA